MKSNKQTEDDNFISLEDRLVYYVDIGNLPSWKAQKILRKLQAKIWKLNKENE